MSTTTKPIKSVIATLNLPTMVSVLIIFAKAVYKAMLNNPYFAGSAAKLVIFNTDTITLENAEVACKTKPPTGTTQTRDAAKQVVYADLRTLRNDVQAAADANPAKALAIIASAAMGTKQESSPRKQQNTAKDSVEEGCVDLIGIGPGQHDWRQSTDDTSWIFLPASRTAKTTVTNLEPNKVYFFQNRQMFPKDVKGEWSPSIKIRTK